MAETDVNTLFDHYVMVDWTGGNARKRNKPDAIWIASGERGAKEPSIENPPSRSEAVDCVRRVLIPFAEATAPQRVLVCFDFAYGYPGGFAAALCPEGSSPENRWQKVWKHLSQVVRDDVGTKKLPSNVSNRFEAANSINQAVSPADGPHGPFWCLFKRGSHEHIPQDQPRVPFKTRGGSDIRTHRITDLRARSDTPFRLFGTGSVGSQVLTGVPCLSRLRFDPTLNRVSAVWPFETGWAGGSRWPEEGKRVVHAEIYPSVRDPLDDDIKDRGQVRAMWHWARDLDLQGKLVNELSIPLGIGVGSPEDVSIRSEEGWILGCPAP